LRQGSARRETDEQENYNSQNGILSHWWFLSFYFWSVVDHALPEPGKW
jgi:hypothetical protein